jgi:hypothetical protein
MVLALAVTGASLPTAASAQPDPANSAVPTVIRLVGKKGNTADPAGLFQVVVRDVNNVPIEGAKVVVEFGGCAQLVIGSEQLYPGVALEQCDPPAVSALTDVSGTASFVVMGGVAHRLAPEPVGPCGVIRASVGKDPPVDLGSVRVAAFDQDGVNGVGWNDYRLFLCDFNLLLGPDHQRSDLDGDGFVVLDAGDLQLMTSAVCGGGSDRSAARCDGEPENLLRRADDGDLYLAWNNCRGEGGSTTASFACNTNSGSHFLIASFRAPAGVDALTGFEAELAVVGDAGVDLAPWWRFQAGGCRAGAITLLSSPATVCDFIGSGGACATSEYPEAGTVLHQQRIRLTGGTVGGGLTAGQEYALFGLQINHTKTTGAGSCTGCNQPVALVLQSVRLIGGGSCNEPASPGDRASIGAAVISEDVVMNITSGSSGAVAYWQGVPSGFSITDVPAGLASTDWLAPPAPNPARGGVTFRFGLARDARVSLAIYDLAGRRVRALEGGTLPAGEHVATWDGRGERGERLAGGLYFLRLLSGDRVLTRPVVRMR